MLRRERARGDPLKQPVPRLPCASYVHARAPLGGWGLGMVPGPGAPDCADCVPIDPLRGVGVPRPYAEKTRR